MDEDERVDKLNDLIEQIFDGTPINKMKLQSKGYGSFHQREFEVADIRSGRAKFLDLYEPLEFPNVILVPEMETLLRVKDAFLAHIGSLGPEWHILYMSPIYEEVYVEMDYNEDFEDPEVN